MSRLSRIFGALLAVLVLLAVGAVSASAAPPSLQASNPKASSPETDLQHFPKRHDTPGTKPAASGGKAAPTVRAVELDDRGRQGVALYTPAPGVTADALVANLRAHGHPTAEVVSADATSPDSLTAAYAAGACSYGTARTLECAPLHWANNGYSDPQVYFADTTSANWPIDQAVYTWNQAVGIDSYYHYGTCGNPAGTHCVAVYDANYGGTGWAGKTFYRWDGNRNFIDGSVYVELNDYYSYNADGYRQDACHELGHGLGLGHNQQDYSCIWFQIKNNAHRVPDSDDFNMLASIYSVVR